MANNNLTIAIIVVVLVLGIGAIYLTSQSNDVSSSNIVFTITDAAANMGSVSSVEITVDKIMAHSQTEGWIEVSSTSKTYDLLKLKAEDKQVLLADAQLSSGSYDQVRLDVSSVIVTDNNGSHEAKLPSSELKIVGNFDVAENTTTSVKFDFIADESLHVTGNGKYIFAPVVQYQTREESNVKINSDSSVEVSGGKLKSDVTVSMDVQGNVGPGLQIPSDILLSLDNNGKINMLSNGQLGINNGNGNSGNNSSSGISVGVGY